MHLHVSEREWEDYPGAGAWAIRAAHREGEAFSYRGVTAASGAGAGRNEGGARCGRARDFRSGCGAELFCASEAGRRSGFDGIVEAGGCAEAVQSGSARDYRRDGLREDGEEDACDGAEDGSGDNGAGRMSAGWRWENRTCETVQREGGGFDGSGRRVHGRTVVWTAAGLGFRASGDVCECVRGDLLYEGGGAVDGEEG